MLELINTKTEQPNYLLMHLKSFQRITQRYVDSGIEDFGEVAPDDLMKLVNHGVRACVLMKKDNEQMLDKFSFFEMVKGFISALTPRELSQIFPVTKEYDGEKWGAKDYFYTMRELEAHGLDTPIGEQIDEILWDYMNHAISMFMVGLMGAASDLYREQTGHGMMEEFFQEHGVPVYHMCKDPDTGKEFMYDAENGRTIGITPAKPRVPRYIKVVQ